MSWDSYIDSVIAQSKDPGGEEHVDRAAVIAKCDGSPWTTADHEKAVKLKGSEGKNIAQCFNTNDFNSFMTSGVYLEGVKYQFLRVEDGKTVMAKKKGYGSVTLNCAKSAIVIAHCPEGKQQGFANKAAVGIGDYLESLGF